MAVNRTGRIVRIIVLLGLSVGMLTLAFAPTSQFYFAWIGLAPWLIFLGETKSQKRVFFISWIAGTAFFVANMWWMANISWPGMFALLIFCGSFWGYAALIIRGAGLLRINVLAGILGIAAVWTAFEWRGESSSPACPGSFSDTHKLLFCPCARSRTSRDRMASPFGW